ncbi:hypothetical protein Taro_049772, partial [Colocasia esculenta]|nr:hypothetical protein [Colocasia esculenta]
RAVVDCVGDISDPAADSEQTGVVGAGDDVRVGDALHEDYVRGCPGGPMAPRPPTAPPSPPPYAVVSTATIATSSGISGNIPLEIVSEEEMALIDAAMASARCLLQASSSHSSRVGVTAFSALSSAVPPLRRCPRSLLSTVPVIRSQKGSSSQDIEDSGVNTTPSKSPLQLFRSRRALTVTDLMTTEWCEKQMEFILLHGKPKRTKAMRAGSDRHAELEKEVVQKVEICIKTMEDSWAVKFLNFVFGTHQLLFEGLTRELPV